MWFILLSIVFLRCAKGTPYQVTVQLNPNAQLAPTVPVILSQYIAETACCGSASSSDSQCLAMNSRVNPTTLSGPGDIRDVSWYGCSETALSQYCQDGVPSTQTLITLTSTVGNCSISLNRSAALPYVCAGIGSCTYDWDFWIRQCGSFTCDFTPGDPSGGSLLTVSCLTPNCVPPLTPVCLPAEWQPWRYDPSSFRGTALKSWIYSILEGFT